MDAWIKIVIKRYTPILAVGSHPTWMRGLKYQSHKISYILYSSHPTWMRGLKSVRRWGNGQAIRSHPS